MSNMLSPGFAGPAAPPPADQRANPPPSGGLAMPAPGPTPFHQHYTSQEDSLALRFQKIKKAKDQVDAVKQQLDKLAAFGDTVAMDDVIEAASNLVAAGIPAVQVATRLAEIPDQPSQLQGWVQEQLQKIAPQEQMADGALADAGYSLGLASMKSIMASSADDFHLARARARARRA